MGVDLPKNKRILIALTYIYGIGPAISKEILKKLNLMKILENKDLTEQNIVSLRNICKHTS